MREFSLNYLLDLFHECTSSNYFVFASQSANVNLDTSFNIYSLYRLFHNWRILLSSIFYCLVITGHSHAKPFKSKSYKSLRAHLTKVFLKQGFIGRCASLYSLLLLSLNFLLIALTIPNISHPGPVQELKVLYHNVSGFVNLNDKSPGPSFYTSKLSDFQGHIFHEKPDVIILNETWLKKSVLDSEIFPNNCYKVFRRDRSNLSHPVDPGNPNKFRKQGGGVVIAFRSDLDVETTRYDIKSGGMAKAEILSVVLKSGSGSKVCFSTLYRVGTLGAENLSEVDRHLRSIIMSKSINKHIFVGASI